MGEQGGDFQECSENHTLKLAGPGEKMRAMKEAEKKFEIAFGDAQPLPQVVELLQTALP